MTFIQWATIAILAAMLVAYASERFRLETVALTGLGTAYVAGVVPAQNIFTGFASPAVITVVEILLLVSALSQSRIMDDIARRIVAGAKGEMAILAMLCAMGAAGSIFMNNIGALALLFPVALSVCAKLDIPSSRVLMPLSFATLLGGMCSLTGTPANLVVNEWKVLETGSGFGYLELALIGGPVALIGLGWVILSAPRFFGSNEAATHSRIEIGPSEFLAEMLVPEDSSLTGLHLPEAEQRTELRIHGVMRHGVHVFARRDNIILVAGDTLLLEGDLARLEDLRDQGSLANPAGLARHAERIEAVVMPDSLLLGSRLGDILMFAENSVRVAALASRRHRIEGSFGDLQIGLGDVLLLAGERGALQQTIADCGLLPLSRQRPPRLNARAAPGVITFIAGVLLSAFNIVPPEIAFGAVVIALIMTRSLNLRTALQDLNWPIVILLACMIPLGQAVQDTGTARVIANALADYIPLGEPMAVVALVLGLAVVVTPFIDNVSTAAVLSPIAAGIATRTGVPIEPLLMAVAIGASLDFMTPFGHHNNAMVMGAAGYRFRDFLRFGGPLTIVTFGIALVAFAAIL
ncbi:cation transporter [Aurantiacibacter xanthus]|uniref:Cation transporter n=2 Tax=Aurantiacibacter xanthus TaxID=1784712 RepID=A0A3A1P615_9SPHN|nr:cation transporter [Aurantiacibacter xanthus]